MLRAKHLCLCKGLFKKHDIMEKFQLKYSLRLICKSLRILYTNDTILVKLV